MQFIPTENENVYEVRNNADHSLGWVVRTPSGMWHTVDYQGLDQVTRDSWGFAQQSAQAAYDYVMAEWEVLERLGNGASEDMAMACLAWLDLLTSDRVDGRPAKARSTATKPSPARTKAQVDEVMDLLAPMGWTNPENPYSR